ncbi:hypothetical protein O6H91_11G037000 [Diphasiastrum complanatum]|uniref:Uncharacterized protein n=5 Tax=Diphasiastrum complanatum TaxID=34168 RepID=A0ACC2C841_DIPCM|nr:hypothetical protein O6H91_11G037000 [Diphasiastrum complanatum]KAJ7538171.1 hypothetical protein O6H91_11G037000 [Diphasiastrum complanatum]KAJ7538172.1 hypothetical protein O6H91_11G037000 [Diphasiastrum complanatum]KAJ7538173.1 hypothetical protein O6H91_11G037000 [Diphasiastrum complanatum]KAJ7538174.1 hypothetical protein O6H91_11G037000 [Diphasiastrum complanatum]
MLRASLSRSRRGIGRTFKDGNRNTRIVLNGCQSFDESISVREAHTSGLYVHHTIAEEEGRDFASAAVTVGLINALTRSKSGVGFFRPIENTGVQVYRSQLIKDVFKLKEDVGLMQGVSQIRAFELLTHDRLDELLEEVYQAYSSYKANHDLVVVEGTHLKGVGHDTLSLNAKVASTLGVPALLVTDAGLILRKGVGTFSNLNGGDWKKDVVDNAKLSDVGFKHENVDIVGALVHGIPNTDNYESLLELFKARKLSLMGAIPQDHVLQSVEVQDLVKILNAELLVGAEESNLSKKVTKYIVATSQLDDLLAHLQKGGDSSVVITTGDRADIILGLISLKQLNQGSSIAALVLAGEPISPEVGQLLKMQSLSSSVPILSSRLSAFDTTAVLASLEGGIGSLTVQKFEHAKDLFDKHIQANVISNAVLQDYVVSANPISFQNSIFSCAKEHKQVIVLPEGEESRTIQAAAAVLERGLCDLVLLGNHQTISKTAEHHNVDISSARVIDPLSSQLDTYVDYFYESRKHKGLTKEQARKTLMEDPNYLGTCMVAMGEVDGMVSGAVHTTADTVRPALQIIKMEPGIKVVSSVFFMCLPHTILAYGDCAINPNPTSEELATIAISSADTAAAFGISPYVAMLSYATGDSNKGPLIDKVADATAIAKSQRPDLLIEGPYQYDAAVNPDIASRKVKGSNIKVAGKANVLIFPDLNASNIAYKAVQQSTGAVAVGPVLQGLRKPVNDLSRGCTVEDIVVTIAVTAVQAIYRKEKAVAKDATVLSAA